MKDENYMWGGAAPASPSGLRGSQSHNSYLPPFFLGSPPHAIQKGAPLPHGNEQNPTFFSSQVTSTSSADNRTFSPLKDSCSIESLNKIIASSSPAPETPKPSFLIGTPPRHSLSDMYMNTPQKKGPTVDEQLETSVINCPSLKTPVTLNELNSSTRTTVFGFPPSELDVIVAYFKTLGSIKHLKTLNYGPYSANDDPFDGCAAGPSWIHIEWATSIDAAKALEKQGNFMVASMPDGTDVQYMLGVVPFDLIKKKLTAVSAEDIIWSCSPVKPRRYLVSVQEDEKTKTNHEIEENIFQEPICEKKSSSIYTTTNTNWPYFDSFLKWIFGV